MWWNQGIERKEGIQKMDLWKRKDRDELELDREKEKIQKMEKTKEKIRKNRKKINLIKILKRWR